MLANNNHQPIHFHKIYHNQTQVSSVQQAHWHSHPTNFSFKYHIVCTTQTKSLNGGEGEAEGRRGNLRARAPKVGFNPSNSIFSLLNFLLCQSKLSPHGIELLF